MSEELIMNFNSGFVGEDLELWSNGLNIAIRDGVIEHIGRGKASGRNVVDFNVALAMPPPANLHTHILDYAFPEVGWDLDIDSLVGDPYGVKYLMLSKSNTNSLKNSIIRFLNHSWSYGVGIIVEFREGGVTNALLDIDSRPTTHLVFGMPSDITNALNQVVEMGEFINGIGISSPLYFGGSDLKALNNLTKSLNIYIHAHISEVAEAHDEDDLEYALKHFRPDAIVHGTYLSHDELALLKDLKIPLIMCLRSNLWFVGRLPDLKTIKNLEMDVGLGTDNASWIKGDLWRELDLLVNTLRARGVLEPKWVLKAATNSAIVGIDSRLREGNRVNILVINEELTSIKYARDKYLATVKRGGPEGVEVLITDGVLRYCSSRCEAVCNNLRDVLSRR